jgi:hypothetical protein
MGGGGLEKVMEEAVEKGQGGFHESVCEWWTRLCRVVVRCSLRRGAEDGRIKYIPVPTLLCVS